MTDLNPADLRLVSHTTSDGVTTRELVLGDVTAVLWAPEHARPAPRSSCSGTAAAGSTGTTPRCPAAPDCSPTSASGRSRSTSPATAHGRARRRTRRRSPAARGATGGRPIGPIVERYNAELARRTVPEWRALLAGLLAVPEIGDSPVGYWGLTLGTAIGVPLVAEEPLIRAAVFGLFWPSTLVEAARQITVPIEFELQWDDEHIPREGGLALFDAFASTEKSLHANAGKHMELPRFEAASAVRFFERHLLS